MKTIQDICDPARARALQATLNQTPTIQSGDALPPFAHQIYFWDPHPADTLGRDGHPATGDLLNDPLLTKRMWAGGRLVFHAPFYAGIRAEKTTTIEGITRKSGRSGPLAFLRLRHDIRQRQGLVISEWQDIVYRPDDATSGTSPQARQDAVRFAPARFDSVMLFRYSALTFNGHRIHYDEIYARHVEGHAGLIVHGPLLAHMLMGFAQDILGTLTEFSYRATAPLSVSEPATLNWNDGTAWITGPEGRLCMEATAR